jgi:hypothetical protein
MGRGWGEARWRGGGTIEWKLTQLLLALSYCMNYRFLMQLACLLLGLKCKVKEILTLIFNSGQLLGGPISVVVRLVLTNMISQPRPRPPPPLCPGLQLLRKDTNRVPLL